MPVQLTERQLLDEAKESAIWAKVRAGELAYFAEHLHDELAGLKDRPARKRPLLLAYEAYVKALEAQVQRVRRAHDALAAELGRE